MSYTDYANGHIDSMRDNETPEIMPHNHDAERAVISSVLGDPASLLEALEIVDHGDFNNIQSKTVFKAITDLFQAGKPTDLFIVQETCKARGVDCDLFIMDAMADHRFSIYVKEYASIVRSAAIRRNLRLAATNIAKLSAETARQPDSLLDEAETVLFSVRGDRISRAVQHSPEMASNYLSVLDELRNNERDIIGVSTGFAEIDKLLAGLQAPHLYILAARPAMGKSALAINIAVNAAKGGHRVMIFSLEMSQYQITQRIVANLAGVDSHRLQRGKINDDEHAQIAGAAGLFSTLPILADDTGYITPAQIRAKAMREYASNGLDLIIIDHLHILRADKDRNNRVLEVADMTASLAALGKQLGVPILLLAQLSRACEQRQNKRPVLSDLRDSGSIEQDSYAVMFLYRDYVYNDTSDPKRGELSIAKHRDGPTGTVDLHWNPKTTTFSDIVIQQVQL